MKAEILTMIISIAANAGVELEQPGVIVTDLPTGVAAQHGVSKKTNRDFVIVDKKAWPRLSADERLDTLVHEVAHAIAHQDHGHTKKGRKSNKNHKRVFKAVCHDLAKANNISTAACSKEI